VDEVRSPVIFVERSRTNEDDEWLKKTFRKGELKGFWVGPRAARLFKGGLVLRDSDHR
jgi:hypothetical protein